MLRAALKSVFAHKVRMGLTTLAIVFGVGFVAGTYLLTDTLNRNFNDLFGNVYRNVSVAVRGVAHIDSSQGETLRDPVPAAVLDTVRKVPGVKDAAGTVSGYAQLIDPRTHKAITTTGAPTNGVSWTGASTSTSHIVEGRPPSAPDEVAVDEHTASTHDLTTGTSIDVVTRDGIQHERLVGTFKVGGSDSLGGATITAFDPPTAQQLLGHPGQYDLIEVAAAPGVSQAVLRDRIAGVLPSGVEAVTGKKLADEAAGQIQRGLSFLNTILLVFALIALFVGTFIIFNTFSMLVAQRTRELALLRALGASRGQVTRSVLVEAAITGVIASTIGLAFGFVVALALQALLGKAIGLSSSGLVFLPRTAIVAYLVGIIVTMVAAFFPARRASRIAPVAAMRDDVALPSRSLVTRAIVGGSLTVAGIAAMAAGLLGAPQPAVLVGVGVGAVFIGVTALSPFISKPVVRTLAAPLPRLFGVPGRLGRENALRSPRRTAATAGALMIGVALVAAMGTLGASLSQSVNKLVDKSLGADLVVTSVSRSDQGGIPTAVVNQVQHIDGTKSAELAFGMASIDGRHAQVVGVSPDTGADALKLQPVKGNLDVLASGGLAVSDDLLQARNWHVGQSVPVTFGRTGTTQLVVGATYQKSQLAGDYVMGVDAFRQHYGDVLDQVVLISVDRGTSVATAKQAVERITAGVPTIKVQDQSEFKKEQTKQINGVVNFVYVLLAMSIVIAVLGIINTLALSVFERTREIGLLRAVGLSRRQLRRTVRLESAVIALFGALLGIALGLSFGAALQHAMASQGVTELAFPWSTIVTTFIASGLVGVLAAAWPALRASRMNVLRAIATE